MVRRPGPVSPVLHLTIDAAAASPLFRQVYDGLRDAILMGRLAAGTRLPSSRVLAQDLGVARNTVLQAFDQLRSEGYVIGRRGGGTRVRATMPDALLMAVPAGHRRQAAGKRSAVAATSPSTVQPAPLPSKRGLRLVASAAGFVSSGGTKPAPFQLGLPALDAFPIRAWARIAGRRWRRHEVHLSEADPAGERPLRTAIASYLTSARGARCTADQVLVLNGAQQALHLIAQVLLDPGEAAWIENPGYLGARMAFEAAGARVVPVPVDGEGIDVAAGERRARGARLAYVTPSHQFPLGAVMSASRRLRLLDWAMRASAWIVEDDYDSEFRYAGRPLPCLQGIEAEGAHGESRRVLYVGTFSKTLGPGLRLGYLVVPDGLVDAFRAARVATDGHTATTEQGVLSEFIAEGHYERHIRHMRSLCAERQEMLLSAAKSRLAGLLALAPDPAGLHLVGWLPEDKDDRRISELAADSGLRISSLARYTLGESTGHAALLLGYAAFDEKQIRDGVDRLARLLERTRSVDQRGCLGISSRSGSTNRARASGEKRRSAE